MEETDQNEIAIDPEQDELYTEDQTEELMIEETVDIPKTISRVSSEEKYLCFTAGDETANDETSSLQNEDVPYLESFVGDSNSQELDSWLLGVKETIMVRFFINLTSLISIL